MSGHLPTGHLPPGHLPTGHLPGAAVVVPSEPPRTKRRIRLHLVRSLAFIARYSPLNPDAGDNYQFDAVPKAAGSEIELELNLYDACAAKWRGNEEFNANEFVLPTRGTGFSYEVTGGAGRSAEDEPRWPMQLGAQVPDGSLIWTCRPAASNALYPVSAPAIAAVTGLTISNVAVRENFKIAAVISGGTAGQSYDLVLSYMHNGHPKVARLQLQVS